MPRVNPQVALQDGRQVQQFRVVVHTMGAFGHVSENHWSIFYLISNMKSVRSNMAVPEYGDPTGELQWETHDYILTNSAIRHWDFNPASYVRVCDIASLFYSLNRHRYEMAAGGSSCRWWCYVALCDFAEWGYIHQNAPAQILVDMYFRYHKTLPRVEQNMPKGEFFPRLIPRPPIYQAGTVPGPNAPPRQDWILVAVNNLQRWTPKSHWTYYEDLNGNHCLCNGKYNLCYEHPDSENDYQYIPISYSTSLPRLFHEDRPGKSLGSGNMYSYLFIFHLS